MKRRITFAQLERILGDLEFVKRTVPGKGVVYERATSGTILIVRLHRPGDAVPDYVIAYVRQQLAALEDVPVSDFEEMLQAVAA